MNNGEKTESDFLNTLRNGQKFNTKIYPTAKKYNLDGKLILAFFIESSGMRSVLRHAIALVIGHDDAMS